jgi:hypothetical protein
MKNTIYTYDFNGKSFRREFNSLGSVTHYCNGKHVLYVDCGSAGLFIAETKLLMEFATHNVEFTKEIIEKK